MGGQIHSWLLDYAKEHQYQGILIETGRDTGWLVDTYLKVGFKTIGGKQEPAKPATVMCT
jgi:hypothetical protein